MTQVTTPKSPQQAVQAPKATKPTLKDAKMTKVAESPRSLLLIAYPKTGKTTLMSKLDNNLILDFERTGVDAINKRDLDRVNRFRIRSIDSLKEEDNYQKQYPDGSYDYSLLEIIDLLKEQLKVNGKNTFKYITIDNSSFLERYLEKYIISKYNAKQTDKQKIIEDTSELNWGLHQTLRNDFESVFIELQKYCECLIMIAHFRDKFVTDRIESAALSIAEIDMPNKLAHLACKKFDVIASLYRKKEKGDPNEALYLSTKVEKVSSLGSKFSYLDNKVIKILDSPDVDAKWEEIFPNK